jgi:hypothetical protein
MPLPYLCSPALIYIAFVSTQIIIDIFKANYRLALYKSVIMVIITVLLNVLCERNMSVVSWIIVFVPFIFTTYSTFLLVYLFGYNVLNGSLTNPVNEKQVQNYTISTNTNQPSSTINTKKVYVNNGSSDPSYQSGWYKFGF